MKIRILSIVVIGIVIAISFGFIIEPKDASSTTFSGTYQPIWDNAIATTIEVAEAMPEDLYSYKPTDVSKTFGQQIIHIGYSSTFMVNTLLKGKQVEYDEPSADGMTKEEVIEYAKEQLEMVSETIKSMDENDWSVEVRSFQGNMMPKSQAMIFVHDHLTNHRAKANLYVRMNNIDPPKYQYY